MDKRSPSVRPAAAADLEEIAKIYDHARAFMRSCGNRDQWPGPGYPSLGSARLDLEDGILYVAESGGEVVGTFVLIIGLDATYAHIENGSWRSDAPYGTIHRIASRGSGVFDAALEFALEQIGHIRVDTHADNAPMRHLIAKAGFSHRGTIYVEDGTPRMAFDYIKEGYDGESQ